ncbi:c-type cytochrome biogenesis protein CcmI [Oceaniglobus trochenteri]|uniref:c-type cytochrome biogenesis protein CcmI n=1 Tax=Oceaniglobus trochenteri TaxID=2763260 RepID=UPI001CFF956B|nr:c-type cytochrome biogenesis protein CcmI [Oceaniglobus trochenteri]
MFWVVIVGLAGVTAAAIVLALLRGGRGAAGEAPDIRIYRDQLDEVERDLARGTLTAEEAGRVRTEVSRRLLEANRAARAAGTPATAPRGATVAMAVLCAVLVVGGGLGTYAWLGAPGFPDLPIATRKALADQARENRPSQAEAERQAAEVMPAPTPDPTYVKMMEQLRETVAKRPDDLRGHQLLARNEARLGRFADAVAAQERVVELLGDKVGAEDHTDLAEYMILAAGGYVSPEAEAALTRALQIDERNGAARYYSGLLYAQTGRPDLAFQLWRGLLETGPEDAPWIAPIREQMPDLAARAGTRYDPPEASGPSAEDMAAAADMAPEDRDAMIRNMVSGLADRLAAEGGPPQDWARLIAAYGVLGETETAAAIHAEALDTFAGNDEALTLIAEAARRAGIAR